MASPDVRQGRGMGSSASTCLQAPFVNDNGNLNNIALRSEHVTTSKGFHKPIRITASGPPTARSSNAFVGGVRSGNHARGLNPAEARLAAPTQPSYAELIAALNEWLRPRTRLTVAAGML